MRSVDVVLRVRRIAHEKGLALKGVFAAAGLPGGTGDRVRAGRRQLRLEEVAALARALDLPASDLLS